MTRPLTRRSCTFPVLARNDGDCHFCSDPIRAGEDYIVKVLPNKKWGHERCAHDYAARINEEVEDAA